jgi:hypothetical protein
MRTGQMLRILFAEKIELPFKAEFEQSYRHA